MQRVQMRRNSVWLRGSAVLPGLRKQKGRTGPNRVKMARQIRQGKSVVYSPPIPLSCRLNPHGQLGLGDTRTRGAGQGEMGAALPFVDLGPGLSAVAVAAGENHTCAVLQPGGLVKCWG